MVKKLNIIYSIFLYLKDMYYSDGGLFEKVPLAPFLDKPNKEILGIELGNYNSRERKIKNIKDFVSFFYEKIINNIDINYDKQKYNIISVNQIEGVSILNFKMTPEDKMRLFFDGYNTARFHSGLAI